MAERKPSEIEAPSKTEMAERMRLASLDGSEPASKSKPSKSEADTKPAKK